MIFTQALIPATLIRRYKRFLVDVTLQDGKNATAYCPNTGSMRGCAEPGSPVLLSVSDNKKRKHPLTLEMVYSGSTWVGVNTARTNAIVAEALLEDRVDAIGTIEDLRREITVSPATRLDLLAKSRSGKIYIEVKNCTLVEEGVAMFPDAVTDRGTRHLLELVRLREQGHRAVIFYLVQREDACSFRPAFSIDPRYAEVLAEVRGRGVEIVAYRAAVSPTEIRLATPLAVASAW